METASALTVVPPWQVNAAGMVVALNDSLCTFINICLREKHKPTRTLILLALTLQQTPKYAHVNKAITTAQ